MLPIAKAKQPKKSFLSKHKRSVVERRLQRLRRRHSVQARRRRQDHEQVDAGQRLPAGGSQAVAAEVDVVHEVAEHAGVKQQRVQAQEHGVPFQQRIRNASTFALKKCVRVLGVEKEREEKRKRRRG